MDWFDRPCKSPTAMASGCWHGFNNTSTEDVVLVWGWMGAGSIEDSGYEVPEGGH